jgi:hemoglobin-like flavoprotein
MNNLEEVFENSYRRVVGGGVGIDEKGIIFFKKFYANFLSSSDLVTEMFVTTDMEQQVKMLQRSMFHMISFYVSKQEDNYLEGVAESHSTRQHNVSPELYDLWLESLVQTVIEVDEEYNDTVGLAWRLAMAPGIVYMKFHYDK